MHMKRKIQPTQSATEQISPDPRLARKVEWAEEARRLISQGLEAEEPARRSLRGLAEYVDQMISATIQYTRGEITLEESNRIFDEVRTKLPRLFPLRPAWLDPALASGLVEQVRNVRYDNPNALNELIRWLRREFARPRGAPIDMELEITYKLAAMMRKSGVPWLQIARDLCSLKTKSWHLCNKHCEDRMRQGAKQYC